MPSSRSVPPVWYEETSTFVSSYLRKSDEPPAAEVGVSSVGCESDRVAVGMCFPLAQASKRLGDALVNDEEKWKSWNEKVHELKPYFNQDTNSILYADGLVDLFMDRNDLADRSVKRPRSRSAEAVASNHPGGEWPPFGDSTYSRIPPGRT